MKLHYDLIGPFIRTLLNIVLTENARIIIIWLLGKLNLFGLLVLTSDFFGFECQHNWLYSVSVGRCYYSHGSIRVY